MGQTSATLCTTASEHFAAISGTHSLAETVLLGTLKLLGLIGTEHAIHLFLSLNLLWRIATTRRRMKSAGFHAAVDKDRPPQKEGTQRVLYTIQTALSTKTSKKQKNPSFLP